MAGALVDALLGSTTEVLVEKAINLASEQIGQFVGFKKDLEKLKNTLKLIQAVLCDTEKEQVTKELVKRWLENLERVAFDAGNLLDDINYEMIQNQMKRKVCLSFSLSNPIALRCRMAKKIQKINMDLISINEQATKLGLRSQTAPALSPPSGAGFIKNRETVSAAVGASFIGRDDDVSAIVTKLTATSNNETISVIPIVGMGGIGKTTVAQKVFNNLNIENHFDKRMWVCVSDFEKHFDANRLLALMLESLKVSMAEVRDSNEARVQKLKEILDGKKPLKYLLVLDDVWNVGQGALWVGFLDSLRGTSSAKGSWVIVTTRNKRVADITAFASDPWPLKELSNDHCWLIISKNAFGDRKATDDPKELGLELVKKCQGLPLAASVLGGMFRNKERNEWQSILDTGLQNIGGDEDGDITKILKLSFDHLQYPSLKKCFAYCSIFPRDFQMERNQLIQLWAAEGFLHPNPRHEMCMEEVGNWYFTILLESNLFQDAEKDDYGNVLNCKMHDLVHDMVQSISESETLRLKESTDFPNKTFQYLAMERSDGEEIPPFPQNESFRCITTLFLLENRSIEDGLIIFLACLRVLNIASSDATELPKSIGKLSHLRYLDSSDTPMKTLPDSLCKLYNLQTLRLRDCKSFTKFPNNFKNLVNLRHFDFFHEDKSSDLTPLEIGQLRSLRTLPFFNIGKEAGRQIGQLGSLKNLSGSFEIRNLQLVTSMEEAKSAKLINKPNIDELKLLWNEIENPRENDTECNQVLEGLHAHQNLKGLMIQGFFGDQLSTWIAELGRLVKFELQNCKNCKELPTLGHMPFLRSLRLEGLDSITSICPSFYGGSGMHSGSSSQRPPNLFPALEYLILKEMQNLREWMEAPVHDERVEVFPVLHTMRIHFCPQLATFPNHFRRLEELNIGNTKNGSALMTYICSGVSTLTELSVDRVKGLTKLPNMLFQNNPKLAHLQLRYCHDLAQFSDFSFDVPQTLGGLNCQSILEHTCIDDNAAQHLVGLESLEKLIVIGCHLLKSISIPKGCKYLTALRQLWIEFCSGLNHLSIPQISESEWDSTSSPSSSGTFPPPLPLEKLEVYSCHKLISFPIDLTRTPSLSFLNISRCEKLTDLPKGKLCSLTSLRYLYIGPFSKTTTKLDSFLALFDALPKPHPYFPSLSHLYLYGWPHWESLPEQLQHLSALTYLLLPGFGVNSLPDGLGSFPHLKHSIL